MAKKMCRIGSFLTFTTGLLRIFKYFSNIVLI